MKICKLEEIKTHMAPSSALLGLDVGTKTIGLSLSDKRLSVATPLEVIERTKFSQDVERIKKVVADYQVGGFVIGLPTNMDGTAGPKVQSIKAFVHNLKAHFDQPAAYWDERLSTKAMEREMLAQDVTRAKRAKSIDKLAAAFILQGALSRLGENQCNHK